MSVNLDTCCEVTSQ